MSTRSSYPRNLPILGTCIHAQREIIQWQLVYRAIQFDSVIKTGGYEKLTIRYARYARGSVHLCISNYTAKVWRPARMKNSAIKKFTVNIVQEKRRLNYEIYPICFKFGIACISLYEFKVGSIILPYYMREDNFATIQRKLSELVI